ncbi:MAG: flagellar basal body L-ring protein FlgH [Pseudomonadota bacterium]
MKNRILISIMAVLFLSACGATERLSQVGKAPELAPIENPAENEKFARVSMPMPPAQTLVRENNSLWGGNKQTFFKDQRASTVGDILTVLIEIDDEAELENETERSRSSTEDVDLGNLLGIESQLTKVLPEGVIGDDLVDFGSNSSTSGEGSTEREEQISMTLAATITQVLPNGNMVIQGRQEVRVNFEKRILELAGIIRPEDILTDNTIPYDRIAEARISYGGKGQITDVQQPRYGQQVYDILFPF